MRIRPLLCFIIILMGWGLLRFVVAEEVHHEEPSVAESTSSDDKQMDKLESRPEALMENESSTTKTRQKERSIKMIVGGQSTDGLAKQVTLPVED